MFFAITGTRRNNSKSLTHWADAAITQSPRFIHHIVVHDNSRDEMVMARRETKRAKCKTLTEANNHMVKGIDKQQTDYETRMTSSGRTATTAAHDAANIAADLTYGTRRKAQTAVPGYEKLEQVLREARLSRPVREECRTPRHGTKPFPEHRSPAQKLIDLTARLWRLGSARRCGIAAHGYRRRRQALNCWGPLCHRRRDCAHGFAQWLIRRTSPQGKKNALGAASTWPPAVAQIPRPEPLGEMMRPLWPVVQDRLVPGACGFCADDHALP